MSICESSKENQDNIVKIIKQRSIQNIFDAEKTLFRKRDDGTVVKKVVSETYAKVTLRKRGNDKEKMENDTKRKRAKVADNVLEHMSEKNKEETSWG